MTVHHKKCIWQSKGWDPCACGNMVKIRQEAIQEVIEALYEYRKGVNSETASIIHDIIYYINIYEDILRADSEEATEEYAFTKMGWKRRLMRSLRWHG